MCFLLGIVANPPRKMEEELMSFRYFANRNRDGWGIGWYTSKGPVIFKNTKNAIKDVLFPRVVSLVHSNVVIAHLRAKTKGNVREVNTHPFSIREYLFAHNGTMDRKPLERELRGEYRKLEGDTDSERLFHFLIQYMEQYGSVHGMRRALRKIDRMNREGAYVGYMNVLMSDGEYFFAFSKFYASRNRGLHYLVDEGLFPRVIFATKPIFEGKWERLENGELVIVDSKTMDVKVTVIG